MKKLIIAITFLLSAGICFGQKKDNHRYFQASYMGQDSVGALKYGSYFFSTTELYFPTMEEVQRIIIDGYKLKFRYNSVVLIVTVTEFKNKIEWLKFNHKME